MMLETSVGRNSSRPGTTQQWIVARLRELGLAPATPARLRHRPRRIDVFLDGRPATLLDKPTTPLWATQ